jgi:hypothetical protein
LEFKKYRKGNSRGEANASVEDHGGGKRKPPAHNVRLL